MSTSTPEIVIATPSDNTNSSNVEMKQKKIENNKDIIDALDLASLLQCLGFSLQNFEKATVADSQPSSLCDVNTKDYLQIEITCMKSHMKAILSKEKIGCKCPSKEDASNAQFWNISACSPSLQGNVTVSKSSLLPTISVNKSMEINGLVLKALNILNLKDNNENAGDFTDLFEKKSLENLKSETRSEASAVHSLSPTGTSSPIPDLSNNSRSISLDTENASRLLESFRTAEKILLDAFSLVNQNSTYTSRARRLSDIKISPLAVEDQKSGSSSILNGNKSNSSCKATPKKKVAKKVTTTGDKRKLAIPPSRIGLLKGKSSDSGGSMSSRLLLLKKDFTSRSLTCNDKPKKFNVSAPKTKLATKPDSSTKSKTPSKIASFAGAKNAK